MKSLFLIFISIFIFPVHAATANAPSNNLIEQTCKKTEYYETCVSTLESDPQSSSADLKGLAKIVIQSVGSEASKMIARANELIGSKQGDDEKTQKKLRSCAEGYGEIMKGDVPKALQALQNHDLESVTGDMTSVVMRGGLSCAEKSLADMQGKVLDLAVVAVSIVDQARHSS